MTQHSHTSDATVPMDRLSAADALRAYRLCRFDQPDRAYKLLEYAIQCGSLYAYLECGRFLRTTPGLSMTQSERYLRCEKILLELLNLLEVPHRLLAAGALELALLYDECLRRPAGALARYLQALRYGAKADRKNLDRLRQQLNRTDINKLITTGVDALCLGHELALVGTAPRLTEFFLREAVDIAAEEMSRKSTAAICRYGQAGLELADFYDQQLADSAGHASETYRMERDKLYAHARTHGYPEYLSRSR